MHCTPLIRDVIMQVGRCHRKFCRPEILSRWQKFLGNIVAFHTTKYDLRYYCPVEWKITQSLADNTLNYLSYMWGMFSFHYFEPDPPSTSSLECVCKLEGSSSITWRVPSYLIPQLINKVKDDTRFFQKHHGILKVTVAGQCVYEQQAAIDNTLVSSNIKYFS